MSGYALGFFFAALAYALLGGNGGGADGHRRGTRTAGVVHPPPRPGADGDHRDHRRPPHPPGTGPGRDEDRFVLRRLLTPPLLHRTLVGTALATGSLIAFWSVSTWYPQIIRQAAAAASLRRSRQRPRRGRAMLFNAGGILGYATWGFLADAVGRRKAFAISFAVSAVSVAYLFPFPHAYGRVPDRHADRRVRALGALSGPGLRAGAVPAQRPRHRHRPLQRHRPLHHRLRPAGGRRDRRLLVRRRPRAGHRPAWSPSGCSARSGSFAPETRGHCPPTPDPRPTPPPPAPSTRRHGHEQLRRERRRMSSAVRSAA